MQFEQINAFVKAAAEVLGTELQSPLSRDGLYVHKAGDPVEQVVAVITFTGDLRGVVLFGMSQETGMKVVSRMMGIDLATFDSMAQSGIG